MCSFYPIQVQACVYSTYQVKSYKSAFIQARQLSYFFHYVIYFGVDLTFFLGISLLQNFIPAKLHDAHVLS